MVGEAGEGWYTVAYTPYWSEAELPGMKTLYEAAMKYRGRSPAEISRLWITGWITAACGVEGIRIATEKVGVENLSGRAVRDGITSMKGFDTGLIPPIAIDNAHPYWSRNYRMYQVRGAKYMPASEWDEYEVVGIDF